MLRSKIYEEARLFIDSNHTTTKDLERLFVLYDRYFFTNEIKDKLQQLGKTILLALTLDLSKSIPNVDGSRYAVDV